MIYFPDTKDLYKKVFWLCKLRWIAVAGILLATVISKLLLSLQINFLIIFFIAGLLALSNVSYTLLMRFYLRRKDENNTIEIGRNINIQIFLDFIFLTLLLHFSGGIENPFIIFYIFHMIISSIMLSKKWTYIHTTIGVFMFASLAITEYLGILTHYSINKYIDSLIQNDPAYLFSALLIFTITSYLVVYITSSLSGQLRAVEQKLKSANVVLLEKDQIKNEYVQRITHDIKGHIAAIKSNLEIVYKHIVAPVDPKNQEFIDKAYNRTQKLNEFIYDLLALTNMRLNDKNDREPIDVIRTLESAVNANKPFAESKNITLTTDFSIQNMFYPSFKSSIDEVISNLLQNAVKYTPDGGNVHIKAFSDDNTFSFTVTDTGYGIPEADLPYIFDEFYRASNVKNTIKDGTGLGLSLVKAIIDRHHGKITAKSNVGEGSEFTVTLPYHLAEDKNNTVSS